jgi:hypothetical protein
LNKAIETFNVENGTSLGNLGLGLGYHGALSRVWDDNGVYGGLRLWQMTSRTNDSSAELGDLSVDAKVNGLTFEVGYSLVQNAHLELQIGFGADWRLENIDLNNGLEEIRAMNEYNGSISPHFQGYAFLSRKIPLALFGRVYYSWAMTETDYSRVYNKLRQQESFGKYNEMSSRANVFGVAVGIAIIIHERDHSFTRSSSSDN